nr:hypothetical protein [Tanacetum cinerariifolium]
FASENGDDRTAKFREHVRASSRKRCVWTTSAPKLKLASFENINLEYNKKKIVNEKHSAYFREGYEAHGCSHIDPSSDHLSELQKIFPCRLIILRKQWSITDQIKQVAWLIEVPGVIRQAPQDIRCKGKHASPVPETNTIIGSRLSSLRMAPLLHLWLAYHNGTFTHVVATCKYQKKVISVDVEAERTVNSISNQNLVVEDHLSLKDAIAAVRNVAQAASHEYGILPSEIETFSAASKLTFRNARHHNAALAIQKKYRGWKGRKDYLTLRKKVVKILAHNHLVKERLKNILELLQAEQGGGWENEGGTTSQLDTAAGMETEELFDFV